MEIYVVKPQDTIYRIAQRYGVSPARLAYDNQTAGQEYLVPGQALLILYPEIIHTVRAGETTGTIASMYQISEKQLYRNNPYLLDRTYLITGQQLIISYEDQNSPEKKVSGYVYPYVAGYILRETLLYIDEIMIFSYGFTEDGELVPPQVKEDWILRETKKFEVQPFLVLTPFSEAGVFNNQLIKIVTENAEMQNTLIANILVVVQEKGYAGVDVDFEYILPEDKEGYVKFVEHLQNVMAENGYSVSVALAPKTSADQKGLLYEGMDYRRLGAAADTVFLMTYEWGYMYGPPMAVAPLNKVREVVEYAVTEIPREKIMMGIPNYGYDWELPYKRGETRAELIGNVEAVRIASENGAEIQYDEKVQSPYFTYWSGGKQHEVWFEDVRSIRAKMELVREKGIRGFGYWNLMRSFRANWLLVNQGEKE